MFVAISYTYSQHVYAYITIIIDIIIRMCNTYSYIANGTYSYLHAYMGKVSM